MKITAAYVSFRSCNQEGTILVEEVLKACVDFDREGVRQRILEHHAGLTGNLWCNVIVKFEDEK